MAQKPIELILLRELVTQLSLPVTLVDAKGRVVFFNEPAEKLLGLRHDVTGELPLARFAEMYAPVDPDGAPIPFERLPIGVALRERRPQQGELLVHDAVGARHRISATSIPLDGQGGTLLGAMSIFWEADGT